MPNLSICDLPAPASPEDDVVAALPGVEQLYREHHEFVWRILGRLGVAREAVDDAVQDVFVVLHRREGEFDARGSVRALLYGIARRVARRHRERARRPEPSHVPEPPAAPAPDEQLAVRQAAALLRAALDAIDEDKRMTFVLVDIEGMSVPEAAQCLGVNLNTTYSRLRAARQLLQRAIARHRAKDRPPG